MKKYFLSIIILLISIDFIEAQQAIWARQANLYNYNGIQKSAFDSNNNVYTTGNFLHQGEFDSLHFVATGMRSFYLTKYDAEGKLKWVVTNPFSNSVQPAAICADKHGHIYVTGTFSETVTFGNVTATVPAGINSSFIVKYDTSGNFIWFKYIQSDYTTSSVLYTYSIAVDDLDNLYFSGYLLGSISVDSNVLNASNGRLVIGKIDSPGNFVWFRQYPSQCPVEPSAMKIDIYNNILIAGKFGYDFLSLGIPLIFGTDSLINSGFKDVFIAKLDSSGTSLWSKKISSPGTEDFGGMSSDQSGNVFLTGSTASYFPGEFFMKKFDLNGNQIWNLSSTCDRVFGKSTTNSEGITYAMINYNDSLLIDTLQRFASPSTNNFILVRIDSSGHISWYQEWKNNWNVNDISTGNHGNFLVCGSNYLTLNNLGVNALWNGEFPYDGLALFSDSLYVPINHCLITGKIFNDIDSNCLINNNENSLKDFPVIAMPGAYYGTSDSLGNYKIYVDSGSYSVKQITPYNHGLSYSTGCALSGYNVTLAPNQQITGIDFGCHYSPCKLLNLDYHILQDPVLCNSIIHTEATICNHGLDTAFNPRLTIRYPSQVLALWSSIPWTTYSLVDSVMTIDLPALFPDSCISILFTDSVLCNTPDSISTFYYYSDLTPANFCFPRDTIFQNDTIEAVHFFLVGAMPSPENDLLVFPNPANNKLFISSPSLTVKTQLKLFDYSGVEIMDIKCSTANKLELDISGLPSGLYILSLNSDRLSISHKISIIH